METKEGLRNVECPQYQPTFNKMEWPRSDCFFNIADGDNCGFCKRPEFYRCIQEAGLMKIPLSHSSVQNFLVCPMLYYLKDIRGITVKNSATSKAIKMGKLWDCAKQRILGIDINMGTIVEDYEIENMEIAKVKALSRAYRTLGIEAEPGFTLQTEFNNEIVAEGVYTDIKVPVSIKGFYDLKYADHFAEDKLSSRPDSYLDIYNIQSQVGTYFLADHKMEYMIMQVARTPDLKLTGQYKNEEPEQHEERVYQDIISRPSFYFIGYDKVKHAYGKKYYRKEFNVEEIMDRFRMVAIMIHDCQGFNGWYKNDKSCKGLFGDCDMLPLCRNNVMSENIYGIKERKGEKI